MSEKAGTTERLERLLGFDPAKSNATTASVVTAAIQEIQEERSKEVQARVKTLLAEAVDLRKKQAETKKKFETEDAKFEKSLGKLLNRIEQMANSEMVTPVEDENQDTPEVEAREA